MPNASLTSVGGGGPSRCIREESPIPPEELLQQARALEETAYFRERYRQRVVVEHRIARLVQLGIRRSRFFGRKKTRFQLLMAATVANLTLVANWMPSGGAVRALLGRLVRLSTGLRRCWAVVADQRRICRQAKMLLAPSTAGI